MPGLKAPLAPAEQHRLDPHQGVHAVDPAPSDVKPGQSRSRGVAELSLVAGRKCVALTSAGTDPPPGAADFLAS